MDIFEEYTLGNIPIRYIQSNITEDIYDNKLQSSILAVVIASKYILTRDLSTTFVINTDVLNSANSFMGILHMSNMSRVMYTFKNNTTTIPVEAVCKSGIWTPFDTALPLKYFEHKYHIQVDITFTNRITNDIVGYFIYTTTKEPEYITILSPTHKLVCGYLKGGHAVPPPLTL